MFISYGSFNKLAKIWWLKTSDTYSLPVLEVGRLKSVSLGSSKGVHRTIHPPQAPGKNPFPRLVQLLELFSQCSLVHDHPLFTPHPEPVALHLQIFLCFIIISSSHLFSDPPLPLCYKTLMIIYRVHLDNLGKYPHFKIFCLITAAMSSLPYKATDMAEGTGTWISLGFIIQPTTGIQDFSVCSEF